VIRRLAIGLAFLIAFPVVAIPCWIAMHRTDLPAANDADLTVPTSEIPQANNGFDDFVEAAELLDWPEGADERLKATRAGEEWDPEWVEEMSARNAQAMESLDQGIGAPAFLLPPYHEKSVNELIDPLRGVQRLVKLSGAQARLHMTVGNYDDAVECALRGLRSGRRISGGEGGNLISLMFATATQGIGLADLDHVVRAAPFTPEASRELIAELEAQRWSGADWKRTWAAEYKFLKASFEELDADHVAGETGDWMAWIWSLIPESYLWQQNRTLSSLAEVYRDLQKRATLNCRDAYPSVANHNEERRLRLAKILLLPNPAGEIIVEIATPNFQRFDLKRCHNETKFSLLQVLIALKAHDDEKASLPAALEDLVPQYLERIPEDRFDGAPLRYSRERQVVYSVGEDFTDSGGGDEFDMHNASEPALRIAF
jgi:hypothetical protein